MENVILHALLALSYTEEGLESRPKSPGEVCFAPYGCFPVSDPWGGTVERPIPTLPMDLDFTTPVFCLYTPSEPSCHEVSLHKMGELYTSSFDRSAPLYIVTHGFLENANLDWMVKMREALLTVSSNVTVLTVDWSLAANPPYRQAVANIRVSGAITGYLVHLLVDYFDVPVYNIHLIGHSLGAHLVSYAGDFVFKATGQKVGRITGLDPAGPYFVNTPSEVRLDPSDADFVDVIHTDAPKEDWEIIKFGFPDPVGHLDYYPNGGIKQAGCKTSAHAHTDGKSLTEGFYLYVGCSHQRSHGFFIESIHSKCEFLGAICDSWDSFTQGSCWGCDDGRCSVMGFHATPPKPDLLRIVKRDSQKRGLHGLMSNVHNISEVEGASKKPSVPSLKVYLGTNSRAPFCSEHYRLTVITSSAELSQTSGGDVARFTVTLRGSNGEHRIPPPEKPTFIEPGGNVSWVGFSSPLGSLTALQADYEEDQGLLHALIFRFHPPSLFIEAFVVEELSSGIRTTFKFCGAKMMAGESHVLFTSEQCTENHQISEGAEFL